MSRAYLDSIRNPQPYPTSDTSNPPSRSHTPVSVSELNPPPYYRRASQEQSNPPSRPRTPASILDLTNPKPYPKAEHAYENPVFKPKAVKATPPKPAKSYQHRDLDKPRVKRYSKTKGQTRSSNTTTPVPSDGEGTQENHPPSKGGSVSSLNLSLQTVEQTPHYSTSFTLDDLQAEPGHREASVNRKASPQPGPMRTTSLDGSVASLKHGVVENRNHETVPKSVPIDTTRSSHPTLTAKEKKEKQLKAAGEEGEEEGEEEEDEVWYRRYEKLLWLVFFLVVIFFALGLGLSLGGSAGYSAGIFAKTLEESCRFSCRNKARYTEREFYPLIVFAIDGLPQEIHQHGSTRNIKRMSQCGVHSHDMIPAFASTTFPNLWSIVTGRYPESHGVYSDYMEGSRQRVFEPRVSQNDLNENEWYKAKPLWQTAREQGVVTASHSWLGNNMITSGNDEGQTIDSKPNYYQQYNSATSPQDMVDTVRQWIKQSDVTKIPQFITVFFEEPGIAVREYGMNSQQANDSLLEVDQAIGSLMDYLFISQDALCFNFIIVSPSGLLSTSCGDNNNNVDFLASHLTNVVDLSTTPDYLNSFARITISAGADESWNTAEELSNILKCKVFSSGSVYARDEIPTRYHYSFGTPEGVYVLMNDGRSFARQSSSYSSSSCQYASDGYDPTGTESTVTFIGFGPDFKVNHGVHEFLTVDLYFLMSHILGVTPEPNNGTKGALSGMLKSPGTFPENAMDFAGVATCPYDSSRQIADYKTGCVCPSAQDRGNAVFSTSASSAARHIPFGAPAILSAVSPGSSTSCKLYQDSYVLSYDKAVTIAKYISLTLAAGFTEVSVPTDCVLTDTRLLLGENPACDAYSSLNGIKQSFLLQPGLSVGSPDAGIITSNMAPLYEAFETDIWSALVTQYRSWADLPSSSDINVVQGPVYDIDHDGLADEGATLAMSSLWAGNTPVPTHYFVVVTRCINSTAVSSCLPHDIQTLAFILPHNSMGLPCAGMTLSSHLMDHRATMQDVERITGLCFFPEWSLSDDVTIRRTVTLMKTELPYTMWTN